MDEIQSSKITSKGQTTIPINIRQALQLNTGDEILFHLEGEQVVIKKAQPLDIEYLKAIQSSFANEWESQEDCEAFDDL